MKTSNTRNTSVTPVKSFIDCLPVDTVDTDFTPAQEAEFAGLEQVIAKGWDTYVELGLAFARIHEARYYLKTHVSFERYCREKWLYSKSQVYYLMAAASLVQKLSTIVDMPLPKHESQVRPLLGLSTDKASIAWKEAIKAGEGHHITAKLVKEAASKFQPKRKRSSQKSAGPMPVAEVSIALTTLEAAEMTLRTDKDVPKALRTLAKVRAVLARYAPKERMPSERNGS